MLTSSSSTVLNNYCIDLCGKWQKQSSGKDQGRNQAIATVRRPEVVLCTPSTTMPPYALAFDPVSVPPLSPAALVSTGAASPIAQEPNLSLLRYMPSASAEVPP